MANIIYEQSNGEWVVETAIMNTAQTHFGKYKDGFRDTNFILKKVSDGSTLRKDVDYSITTLDTDWTTKLEIDVYTEINLINAALIGIELERSCYIVLTLVQEGVPDGGSTGHVLKKASNDDQDTIWGAASAEGLPAGGTTGQALIKASNTDLDTEWATIEGGSGGVGKTTGDFKSGGIVIPLYSYPTDIWNNTMWETVIETAKNNSDVSTICIINPASGPGTVADGNYTVGIQRLKSAGISVIGYVDTNYTTVDQATVITNIDKWLELYPEIDGIFYDQMTNYDDQTKRDYYGELTTYVKDKELVLTMGNCGAAFHATYIREECADIIVGWENSVWPNDAQIKEEWLDGASTYDYRRRSIMLYDVADITAFEDEFNTLTDYYGWLYLTEDVLPNPYDGIPTYITDLYKMKSKSQAKAITEAIDSISLDDDAKISSIYEKAGSVSVGEIALTNLRQALNPVAYPKLFGEIGTTWGGDGTNDFYIPSLSDIDKGYVGDWTEYIPSFGGFTPTNYTFKWRRVGSSVEIQGFMIAASPVAAAVTFSLPVGQSVDLAVWPNNYLQAGTCYRQTVDTNHVHDLYMGPSSGTNIFVGFNFNSATPFSPVNGSSLSTSGERLGFQATVPISGWDAIPADMTYVIYAGSGTASQPFDAGWDTWRTEIDNKLAVVVPPYTTGWVFPGSFDNATFLIEHGLSAAIAELDIVVSISTDGSDTNSLRVTDLHGDAFGAGESRGYQLEQINDTSFNIKTAIDGLTYLTSGSFTDFPNSGAYKVVVTKKAGLPLIQANYAPVKDWVEVWGDDLGDTPIANPYTYLTDGRYSIELEGFSSSDRDLESEFIVKRDTTDRSYFAGLANGTDYIYGFYDTSDDQIIINGSGAFVNAKVRSISRWEDTTGANKPNVALSDGYETVWEGSTAGNVFNSWGAGDYKVKLIAPATGTIEFTSDITVVLGHASEGASCAGGAISNRALYSAIDNFNSYGDLDTSAVSIIEIRKAIGQMTLSVNHTNRTISGVPQTFMFKKDTTAGDVTMTADVNWSTADDPALNTYPDIESPFVIDGDILVFHNSGTHAADKGILGAPQMDAHRIGPACKVRYIADKDNHIWVFDDLGTVVDRYRVSESNTEIDTEKYASGMMSMKGMKTDQPITVLISFSEDFINNNYFAQATGEDTGANYFVFNRGTRTVSAIEGRWASIPSSSTDIVTWTAEGYWKDPDTIA